MKYIEAVLYSDSVKLKTDRFIYPVCVRTAVSEKNITVITDRKFKIISKGENLNWGDSVRIKNLFKISDSLYKGNVILHAETTKPVLRLRKRIKDFIGRKIELTGSENGLSLALLTGSRDNLIRDDIVKFRKAGCAHLLALSGMHLGIISLFFYFLLKPLLGVRTALFAVNIINLSYLVVSGLSASLIRACILTAILSYAKARDIKIPLLRALFLTFIINVVISPHLADDLSFQYSYLALTGIVLYARPLYRIFLRFMPPLISAPLSCSVSAQLFTAPLSAYVFKEVFFSGIAASVLLTPLITVFMWSSLMGLFIPQTVIFSFIAAGLRGMNNFISSLIMNTASLFSVLPPLRINTVTFTLLIIFNLSVIIMLTAPSPGLKIFKRYR